MPRYIDHHSKLPPLPPEAMEAMKAKVRSGQTDAYGAKAINGFFTADGAGYCITEAPNADAVCKSHVAVGIPVEGKVSEIVSSLV